MRTLLARTATPARISSAAPYRTRARSNAGPEDPFESRNPCDSRVRTRSARGSGEPLDPGRCIVPFAVGRVVVALPHPQRAPIAGRRGASREDRHAACAHRAAQAGGTTDPHRDNTACADAESIENARLRRPLERTGRTCDTPHAHAPRVQVRRHSRACRHDAKSSLPRGQSRRSCRGRPNASSKLASSCSRIASATGRSTRST